MTVLVEEALSHHRAGRLAQAEALYRQILNADKDNLDALQLLGTLACDTDRAGDAVAMLEQAEALIRKHQSLPEHAALYINLGIALGAVGRSHDAVASYRRGLSLDSKMPELHAALATELGKQGDLAGAAAEYEAAVHIRADQPDWLHRLGGTYAAMGKVDVAIHLFLRTLALQPDRQETLHALSLALLSLGKAAEAIAPLTRLVALQPDNPTVLSELGRAQYGAKQWQAALTSFNRVLALKPGDAEASWLIGSILHVQGQMGAAEAAYRQALRLNPNLPGALFNLGLLLHRDLGKPAEAIEVFERLVAVTPGHGDAYVALGNARRSLGRSDLAIDAYQHYVEQRPDAALGHVLLGESLSETGQKEQALVALKKALTLGPGRALAHLAQVDIGNILQDLGRGAEARDHFRQALGLKPLLTHKAAGGKADFAILLVLAPGANNTPYEYLVDRTNYDSHVLLFLPDHDYDAAFLSSRCDLVVNLVSDADQGRAVLPAVAQLIDQIGKKVVNRPDKIAATGREAVSTLLSSIPSCRVARVTSYGGGTLLQSDFFENLGSFQPPFLARLSGRHGGDDFEMIASAADLEKLIARHPTEDHYLIEYLDYQSVDGFFRKYRFFFVGNEILPYHLAIGSSWKVHHFRTEMADHPWMQKEEEEFLRAPEAVFGIRQFAALRAIRGAIGLDYFGVDCSLDRDGNVIVFEVNASMLAHDNNYTMPYKTPYVRRIKAAFAEMLKKKL